MFHRHGETEGNSIKQATLPNIGKYNGVQNAKIAYLISESAHRPACIWIPDFFQLL